MYAYDVNGDGLNDVITSIEAHGYGLAWYEQVTLLRKIHFLATNTTRHQEVEKRQKRQAEAIQLLEELPALADCTKR